ncbi:MAG: hypothetical protein AABZ02_01170 [Bacteroidota bacterium]
MKLVEGPEIVEAADLHKLPRGRTVVVLPMKIKGGSGGPPRIAAVMN